MVESLPIILVTCAAGSVGREVVKHISKTGKFVVRAGVRDVNKAQHLFDGLSNVQVVSLDKDPEAAFEGIYGLYLLIASPIPGDTTFNTWIKIAIDHYQHHHLRHLVFHSSATSVPSNPVITNQITFVQNEEVIKSGIPYTLLKPTFYHQNTEKFYVSSIKQKKIIASSHNGKYTVVDVRDIAAVAAKIFEDKETHLGKSYYLTTEIIDDNEHAKLLTEAGAPVEYVDISREDYTQLVAKFGIPPIMQEMFVALDEEKEKELSLPLRNDLAEILGRPGISFKQYITEFVTDLKQTNFR